MGVTIKSKNKSIDLGYGGFARLREKVAELAGNDIGIHYKRLNNAPYFESERKKWFKEYDKRIAIISENHHGKLDGILDFLYSSDCGAKMSVDVCKQIYEVIKDYDDNILYGYAGRSDCTKFRDFKELVKDCIDNNCDMEGW